MLLLLLNRLVLLLLRGNYLSLPLLPLCLVVNLHGLRHPDVAIRAERSCDYHAGRTAMVDVGKLRTIAAG